MLVLKRKMQEQIKIGDNIVITVVRIRGHAVSIGIDAPSGVRVLRAELPELRPSAAEPPTEAAPQDEPLHVTPSNPLPQPLSSRVQARREFFPRLSSSAIGRPGTSVKLGLAAGCTY